MATTKGLKYIGNIGNLNPHQQIHSFSCVIGLFRHSFFPFCNRVHEVNMTHASKCLTHLDMATPVLIPSPRYHE